MFELNKTFPFEAAHCLTDHDGKCRRPHGHSYRMTVTVRSESLAAEGPKKNMVIDFGDIANAVKPIIEEFLDHRDLNETLDTDAPTAEFIARWVFERLQSRLPHLYSVAVQETDSAQAVFSRL